jgi:hypothetical protein
MCNQQQPRPIRLHSADWFLAKLVQDNNNMNKVAMQIAIG